MNYIDPDGLNALPVPLPLLPPFMPGSPLKLTPQQQQVLVEFLSRPGQNIRNWLDWLQNENTSDDKCKKESTPKKDRDKFKNVKGSDAKENKETGEIWDPDKLHKDHYEVYKNKKDWEKGNRDRSVWNDGRIKEIF